MTFQYVYGCFWMFWLGLFQTIGGVIMVISALTNGNEDCISEPKEKLIDHSVDDLPAITLIIKNDVSAIFHWSCPRFWQIGL
jgi:hypothetical protein